MRRTAGLSLMLLIFLSLCLITFSLLSLSGATADEKLSKKAADRTTAYYEALSAANEILDEIDTQLAALLKEAQDAEDPREAYLEACAALSVAGAELTWAAPAADAAKNNSSDSGDVSVDDSSSTADSNASVDDNQDSATDSSVIADNHTSGSGTLSFDVAVTDDQHLHMELSITWPEADTDTLYQITCQQLISTQDWTADTSQNLYRTGSSG